jgi:hypothetical protein
VDESAFLFWYRAPEPLSFHAYLFLIREKASLGGSSASLSVVIGRLKLRTIADNFSVDSVINARHQRISVTNLHNLASAARGRRAAPLTARFRFSAVPPLYPLHLRCKRIFLCICKSFSATFPFRWHPFQSSLPSWLRHPQVADSSKDLPPICRPKITRHAVSDFYPAFETLNIPYTEVFSRSCWRINLISTQFLGYRY